MENQKTKKMPSEHRIEGMDPGQTKLIQNDHGTYILVRVPMEKKHSYHEMPNQKETIRAVSLELEKLQEWVDEGEAETHQNYLEDNMTKEEES